MTDTASPPAGRPSPFRRISRGLGSSWLGQGSSVVSRLLEIPLVIAFWGVETYGIWLVLNVIPTLLTASDFGIGTVTDRIMARELNEGRKAESIVTYHTSMLISVASSLLFSLIIVGGFASGLAQPLIGLKEQSLTTTMGVVTLLCARVVVQMTGRVSQAGLFSIGRYPLGMLLSGLGDFFNLLAFLGAVVLGGGLVAAAMAQLFAGILTTVVLQFCVRKYAPWLTFSVTGSSMAKLREMASPAFATFSLGIARSINYSVPRVVVAAIGGPIAATVFHAHRQLARLINFMLLFGRPFQAEIALTYRGENSKDFNDLAERTVQLFVWISLGSALAISVFAAFFFRYWTHDEIAFDPTLFGLLVLTTLLESLGTCALLAIAGINRHQLIAKVFLIANGIGFALAYPLCHLFGIYGMAAALVVVDLITTCAAYPRLALILNQSLKETLQTVAKPPLWVLSFVTKRIQT